MPYVFPLSLTTPASTEAMKMTEFTTQYEYFSLFNNALCNSGYAVLLDFILNWKEW